MVLTQSSPYTTTTQPFICALLFFLRCESTSKRLFYPPEKMIVVIFAYIVRLQTPRLQANILQEAFATPQHSISVPFIERRKTFPRFLITIQFPILSQAPKRKLDGSLLTHKVALKETIGRKI